MFTLRDHIQGFMCFIVALLAASCSRSPAGVEDPAGIEPRVRTVVEDASKHILSMKSFSVTAGSGFKIRAAGMNSETTSTYHVALQRPDRFAVVLKEGNGSGTIVCDGTHLYTHLAMFNEYTVKEAVAPDQIMIAAPYVMSMGGGGMMFLASLFGADPAADMLEGVTRAHYVGTVDLDGVKVHHMKFIQDQFDWELWVEAGDKPLIRKISADMGKTIRQGGEQAARLKNASMQSTLTLKDWKVNVDLPPDTFKFEPPEGAEKVDALMEGFGGRESHALVGETAPAVKLKLLGGGEFDLATHKGKHIVILDFWASWCGPCVQALPAIAEVAGRFKDKGVVLYAINVNEEAEEINDFLERKKLSIPVPLDKDSEASEAYQVEGIPQLVLIGKDGVVQAVHVGYTLGMEKELAEQIEALLAGRSLAAEAARKSKRDSVSTSAALEADALPSAWTVKGDWQSVACDPAGRIYAIGFVEWMELDARGKQLRRGEVTDAGSTLRLAELDGTPGMELVSFDAWGKSVAAHGSDGRLLWSYPGGQGVDDVWPADLDGDGVSEIVVGFNGATGLHVLDMAGKVLWKDTSIGNVWHVCAGDINGDGKVEVVTTSAQGKVHVFSRQGKKLKDLDSGSYANMVRLAGPAAGSDARDAVVGGMRNLRKQTLVRLAFDGQKRWSIDLTGGRTSYIDSTEVATRHPLAAVGLRDGIVLVVDLEKGEIIGIAEGQGQRPQVAWCEPADAPPLIVVATGEAINAFRVGAKN